MPMESTITQSTATMPVALNGKLLLRLSKPNDISVNIQTGFFSKLGTYKSSAVASFVGRRYKIFTANTEHRKHCFSQKVLSAATVVQLDEWANELHRVTFEYRPIRHIQEHMRFGSRRH